MQPKDAGLDGISDGKASEHRRCGHWCRQRGGHFQVSRSTSARFCRLQHRDSGGTTERNPTSIVDLPEYAGIQPPWKEDRSRCVNNILHSIGDYRQQSQERIEPHWQMVLTQPTVAIQLHFIQPPPTNEIWRQIIPESIRGARPTMTASPRVPHLAKSKQYHLGSTN